MNVKQFVKLIKKDEGSGLILALMTLMVLSILGAALGAITIGSYKLGDINRDDNSAYYIAEAGVNLAYDELQIVVNETYKNSQSEESFFSLSETIIWENIEGKIYNNFEQQFSEQPNAAITIEKSGSGTSRDYIIKSVGTIGQMVRTVEKPVKVTWIAKSDVGPGSSMPPLTTSVARNKMTISNNVIITGALHLDSLEPGSLNIGNNVVMDSTVYVHPDAIKDTVLSTKTDGVTVVNREAPLDWKVYEDLLAQFPAFPINPDYTTLPNTIETNGKNISIVLDHLSLINSEVIQVNGGGRVDIFVKNDITIGNDVFMNRNGDSSQLQLFYSGTNKIEIKNSMYFNGTFFLDKADIDIGNNASLKGLLISGGDNVTLGGGILDTLLIAPNANVTLDNSGNDNNISGIMVGNNINLVNNLKLDYDDYYLTNFPLQLPDPESDGSGDGSGGGDLIVTEPGIEN